MLLTRDKRFKKDYSKKDLIEYLKGVGNALGKSPTYRDLHQFPGPTASTFIRRFGSWSRALQTAGIRPQTHQLKHGERTFIRQNWRKMTDKEIAGKLGVTEVVIKYYRMNSMLWKNHKGTAKSTFRKKAFKLYGEKCEVCSIDICDWHHIVPKSRDPKDWCILCPTCHAVISRGLVKIDKRNDIKDKLKPFIEDLYKEIFFN